MKKIILLLMLFVFSLNINAQQRHAKQKCVITKIEHLVDHKVKVTTTNKCTKVITVKTYLKKEWEKLLAKRKDRAKKRRKKN